MWQFLQGLFTAQPPTLFIVAGLIFLGLAVVGSVKTYFDPGVYGRIASGVLGVILLVSGLWLNTHGHSPSPTPIPTPAPIPTNHDAVPIAHHDGTAHPQHVIVPAQQQATATAQTSAVCNYLSGPLAGRTYDYAPYFPAAPVGTDCHDGLGSFGKLIARPTTKIPLGYSTVCKFTSGPAIGTTQDYAPAAPLALDAPCQNGQGSFGIIVPR